MRQLIVAMVGAIFLAAPHADGQAGSRPGETRAFGGITFVWCPPGEATLGTELPPDAIAERVGGRPEWYGDEGPHREVRFEQGFWISQTPITVADWVRIGRDADLSAPAGSGGTDRPITRVTVAQIRAFLGALEGQARGQYRLPTEDEWEYACRAGGSGLYPFGDDASELDQYAWYRGNAEDGGLRPVGQKSPNEWGLLDMLGNAWEVCGTPYTLTGTHEAAPGPGHFVIRGGSVNSPAGFTRPAFRAGRSLASGHPEITFRVVREAGR